MTDQTTNYCPSCEALQAENAEIRSHLDELYNMPARVVEMCHKRRWSMHWTHRGAYLHLESSELIEAIRGKYGDPAKEAGDVLLVLMSIIEYHGIPLVDVIQHAKTKLEWLETAEHYPGEEYAKRKQLLEGE